MNALITSPAAKNIIQTASICEVETGGILVGTINPMVIFAAGSPGKLSVQRPTMFTSDAQEDRKCLTEARSCFGEGVTCLGWWHKHPTGLSKPSCGDLAQASKLAAEYSDGIGVLVAIVNVVTFQSRRKRVSLFLWSVDKDGNISKTKCAQIPQDSPDAQEALKKARSIPGVYSQGYWQKDGFMFYENEIGRRRIITEIRELKSHGWSVKTARQTKDKVLILWATKNQHNVRMLLPPEYPLNPPLVFNGTAEAMELDILHRWSSLYSLESILKDFTQKGLYHEK